MTTGESFQPGGDSSLKELEAAIRFAEDNYSPNEKVTDHISDIHLGLIIGVWAIGKSTVMAEVIKHDVEFGIKAGVTSREPRPGDPSRTVPHTIEGLMEIYRKIKNGDLVQYKVHPQTGFIYGSEPEDYTRPYVLIDAMAQAVDSLHRIPFKSFSDTVLVASPQQWFERMKKRSKGSSTEDIKARLREAEISLTWCLEQDDKLTWVLNKDGGVESAALNVIGINRNNRKPNPENRKYGEQMLKALKQDT
jgi:guanylate kinase